MSATLAPGMQINRFQLEAEVGRGGMGIVFRAHDPALNRPVALKLLAPHLGSDPAALARFHREAALVAGLKHPHIAIVYEFGEHEGRPYIVMEWIEGRTLKDILLDEGSFAPPRVAHLLGQLAGALDYAHGRGVVHRDLKPANILIGMDTPGVEQATIVDFGLAWLETAPSITATGSIMGTPLYMAPEQILGRPTDGRADQYSLGVIVYEMLAGSRPFDSDSTPALLNQKLVSLPPPITELNPRLPAKLDAVLNKALAKEPTDRYASAAALANAVQQAVTRGRPHSLRPRLLPRVHFRWRWAAAVVALIIACGLLTVLANGIFSEANNNATPPATNGAATTPADEATETAAQTNTTSPSLQPEPTNALAAETLPAASLTSTVAVSDTAAPSENGWWPGVNVNARHTRLFYEELRPLLPKARWSFPATAQPQSGLIALAGFVAFAAGDGVYVLNWATGEPLWETHLGVEIVAAPALYADDNLVVLHVPTADGELYGFGAFDARLLWRVGANDLDGVLHGGVVVSENSAVFGATDSGILYAIDPYSGGRYRAIDLSATGGFDLPPAVTTAAVFLNTRDGQLLAVDTSIEEVAWTATTNGVATTPPVVGDGSGLVYTGTEDGWVHAFAGLSGREVWQAEVGEAIQGLAASWSHVFATTPRGQLIAWDAYSGEEIWRQVVAAKFHAPPITNGSYVIVAAADGLIHTFDAVSGAAIAGLTADLHASAPTNLAITGGWLFLTTADSVQAFAGQESSNAP